jgi:hypothetical protein
MIVSTIGSTQDTIRSIQDTIRSSQDMTLIQDRILPPSSNSASGSSPSHLHMPPKPLAKQIL